MKPVNVAVALLLLFATVCGTASGQSTCVGPQCNESLASHKPTAENADTELFLPITMNPVAQEGILPPYSTFEGQTYGEWSAQWWQWLGAQPAPVNPLNDPTGENCARGQSGSVWYLAGSSTDTAVRSCTIPAGKHVFFPISNCAYVGFPTDPSDTPERAITEAKACFDDLLNGASLSAEIDGTTVESPLSYRAPSPVFTSTLPLDNLWGITETQCPPNADRHLVCGPNAADGVYVMLEPLSPGSHILHFQATGGSNHQNVTYNLTVEE